MIAMPTMVGSGRSLATRVLLRRTSTYLARVYHDPRTARRRRASSPGALLSLGADSVHARQRDRRHARRSNDRTTAILLEVSADGRADVFELGRQSRLARRRSQDATAERARCAVVGPNAVRVARAAEINT